MKVETMWSEACGHPTDTPVRAASCVSHHEGRMISLFSILQSTRYVWVLFSVQGFHADDATAERGCGCGCRVDAVLLGVKWKWFGECLGWVAFFILISESQKPVRKVLPVTCRMFRCVLLWETCGFTVL